VQKKQHEALLAEYGAQQGCGDPHCDKTGDHHHKGHKGVPTAAGARDLGKAAIAAVAAVTGLPLQGGVCPLDSICPDLQCTKAHPGGRNPAYLKLGGGAGAGAAAPAYGDGYGSYGGGGAGAGAGAVHAAPKVRVQPARGDSKRAAYGGDRHQQQRHPGMRNDGPVYLHGRMPADSDSDEDSSDEAPAQQYQHPRQQQPKRGAPAPAPAAHRSPQQQLDDDAALAAKLAADFQVNPALVASSF
jgi:hypothetical protein